MFCCYSKKENTSWRTWRLLRRHSSTLSTCDSQEPCSIEYPWGQHFVWAHREDHLVSWTVLFSALLQDNGMVQGSHHWKLHSIISEWWALNRNNPFCIFKMRSIFIHASFRSLLNVCIQYQVVQIAIEGIPHIATPCIVCCSDNIKFYWFTKWAISSKCYNNMLSPGSFPVITIMNVPH